MSQQHEMNLSVGHMPADHIVVGYCAHLKVMDAEGQLYFATRVNGLNDMEMYGMAQDMANTFADTLSAGKKFTADDDDT